MEREYIVWAPAFSRRNGVRVLMLLAERLVESGAKACLYAKEATGFAGETSLPVISSVTETQRRDAVVVYPEVVAGNPLRIRNVVRYVLFHPGRNGGAYRYFNGETIFAFRPEFYPGAPVLTVPWIDAAVFYDAKLPRTQDCCLVHKGGRWRDAPETKGLRVITMQDPSTRQSLADLLRTTRTLYSYDDCTAVMDEAICCGAHVEVITDTGTRPYPDTYSQVVRDFPDQFNEFLRVTSKMDYRGPLECRIQWKCWLNSLWLFVLRPFFVSLRRFGR